MSPDKSFPFLKKCLIMISLCGQVFARKFCSRPREKSGLLLSGASVLSHGDGLLVLKVL